jgi:hypothetical protein
MGLIDNLRNNKEGVKIIRRDNTVNDRFAMAKLWLIVVRFGVKSMRVSDDELQMSKEVIRQH